MQKFRNKYEELYAEITAAEANGGIVRSRGLSLALTKIEESAMWLNKSITKND